MRILTELATSGGWAADNINMSIFYTKYYPIPESNIEPKMDDDVLEETWEYGMDETIVELAQFYDPQSFEDTDSDGFREVRKETLEKIVEQFHTGNTNFPLATFFDDSKERTPFYKRLEGLPEMLKTAISRRDGGLAAKFFERASNTNNPLKESSVYLAKYLAGSAKYDSFLDDASIGIDNDNGFSVSGDGRMRLNCQQYGELALSAMERVKGLTFTEISLSNESEGSPRTITTINPNSKYPQNYKPKYNYDDNMPQISGDYAHLVLLITDSQNRHLLIDNNEVTYFEGGSGRGFVEEKYKDTFKLIEYVPL